MRGEYSLADIAAATGNGTNGAFGDGAWWIIIIIILFGGWGRNNGFGGNGGGTSVYEGYVLNNDFSQLSKQISDTYNMTDRKLDGISNGLCSLGYQELQNINGVNTNLFNGFSNVTSAITTNGYEDRIAINGIGSQMAQCCCDLKQQLSNNMYETAKGFCGINNTIALSTRDIVDNMNANYRALHDEIIANRMEDKDAQITMLQNQLNKADWRASQNEQTCDLKQYVSEQVNPRPYPAYVVPNPYCNCNNGCGCNC